MQKISFRGALTQCGVGLLVIFLAFVGSFLIREARSFINPASDPGASGVLGLDVGVIGNPNDGITGADTLFKGQKAISDKEGNPADGIPGALTLFKGQKAIKDAIGGGSGGLRTKRVFVTSTTYNGNLGGLAGADAKCQMRADAATLGGTWRAILSDDTTHAAQRIGYNWDVLVDLYNRPVISRGDIWNRLYYDTSMSRYSYLAGPILVNELNIYNSNNGNVWTGTTLDGLSDPGTCNDWASSSSSLLAGTGISQNDMIGYRWVFADVNFCNVFNRLYCIEQ